MADCELLQTCGFFKHYKESLNLACRSFIRNYCSGPLMDECKRKAYRKEHGVAPPDDLLPSGQIMPKEYQT